MAWRFDPKQLTNDEREALEQKINKKVDNSHPSTHIVWIGGHNGRGYPQMRVGKHLETRMGITCMINPAHIMYCLKHGIVLNTPQYEISHLCHAKSWINVEHINYEPRHVNKARQVSCAGKLVCTGHDMRDTGQIFPKCILGP